MNRRVVNDNLYTLYSPNPNLFLHCSKPAITGSAGLFMEEEQEETQ